MSPRSTRSMFCRIALLLLCLLVVVPAGGCALRERRARVETTETETSLVLEFGGRERTYLVHLPSGYRKGKPVPLVLALHGGTRDAASTVRLTGLDATADANGFIVAYPNGTGAMNGTFTWNVRWGYGYAMRNNVDDVGFIRALVAQLEKDYSVDPRRVYATGISNGGMLSYLLASEASDVFAAVAPVAGAVGASPSPGSPLIRFTGPAEPVSVIAFHGTADRAVPYDGGEGAGLTNAVYLPVSDAIASWVAWDGCGTTPARATSTDGNVVVETYSGGRNGTAVELVAINDGRHTWPGGSDYPSPGGGEVRANELMWEFFAAHPKAP